MPENNQFFDSLYELIVQTSTKLPDDVREALDQAKEREDSQTSSGIALSTIDHNISLADEAVLPLCQDTGMPTFKIKAPTNFNQLELTKTIKATIVKATEDGKLRTNSVDSLTGENSGNNLGPGTPVIHFEQWEQDYLQIKLLLKGGGCENKNIQYSLPCELEALGKAGRDLDGVRKCILHAVYQAQGQGCSAGFIGVSIGGDRTSGYTHAKEQLFRKTDDLNPNPKLAELENYIMQKANTLGIGTMGFGGEVTLLGCKIGVQNRLPASFFVSVAYNCWAFRRLGIELNAKTGEIQNWLYTNDQRITQPTNKSDSSVGFGAAPIKLTPPISEEQIRELKVGDIVLIDGTLFTGRDAIHKHLSEHECPVNLNGQIIYHCGPVVLRDQTTGEWQIKAAGPTTSIREEPYQAALIKKLGLRAVMGKGGMGAKTLAGLKEHGAVYLNAIGGAAQYYSKCIKNVNNVNFLDFGIPEAMWELEVKAFPAIVTMDARGNSLHAEIDQTSLEKLAHFKETVFV